MRTSGLRKFREGDRVLVIRPGALGDMILSLPSLQTIRRKVGNEGRIELVGYPTPSRFAVSPLHADNLHSIDRPLFSGLFSGEGYPGLREFLEPFDVVVAWCVDEDGLMSRYLESLAVPFLQNRPFPDVGGGIHAADHLMRTLAPFGLKGPTPNPELRLPAESHDVASKLLSEKSLEPDRFLAIHPGSGSPRKNWNIDHFAELIGLARENDLGALVLEGEADRDPVRRLRLSTYEGLPVVKDLDLMTLAAILSRSRAYVGNDSGITHLAAALGNPTFAMFGPTRAAVWAPRGLRTHVLPFSTNPNGLWEAIRKASSL